MWPFRTEMRFAATISLNTFLPFASPMSLNTPASQSESSCSMPSLPFHFGLRRSSHVFGSSSFFTSLVLYACTKTLSRVPTHSPCGRMAGAIRSAWCGLFTSCRIFSRCSDSSSGPLVSMTSTVNRLARRLLHGAMEHVLATRRARRSP